MVDILKEATAFLKEIELIAPKIYCSIRDKMKSHKKDEAEIILNLTIHFYLTHTINLNSEITRQSPKYDLWVSLKTPKTAIFDGEIEYIVWNHIQENVDLTKYPRFEHPRFTIKY